MGIVHLIFTLIFQYDYQYYNGDVQLSQDTTRHL